MGGGLSNVYVVFRGIIKISTFIYMGGGGVKKGRNLVYVEKVCPHTMFIVADFLAIATSVD